MPYRRVTKLYWKTCTINVTRENGWPEFSLGEANWKNGSLQDCLRIVPECMAIHERNVVMSLSR